MHVHQEYILSEMTMAMCRAMYNKPQDIVKGLHGHNGTIHPIWMMMGVEDNKKMLLAMDWCMKLYPK